MSKSTQFQIGNPGGPGRPLGSKNKLSEFFLFELASHFEEHGRDAIEQVFRERPAEYLRIIASLIPRELILEKTEEETVCWVINAQPQLTEKEWRLQNGLEIPAIESKVAK